MRLPVQRRPYFAGHAAHLAFGLPLPCPCDYIVHFSVRFINSNCTQICTLRIVYFCVQNASRIVDLMYILVYNNAGEVIMMPMSYAKLFQLMESKGLKKFDLRKAGISPTIVDRLIKGHDVNTSTITRLCRLLGCQPGDIMEYVDD